MNLSDDISVEFKSITLVDAIWIIHRFNLVIEHSDISKSQILVNKAIEDKQTKLINISSSTFGHLRIASGYQIHISKCNSTNTFREQSLLDITNCSLDMMNCTFHYLTKTNSGAAILKAVNSYVQITNMKCSKNYASHSLLHIQNNSHLKLDSSVFKDNGYLLFSYGIISSNFNSTVHISGSTFEGNSGRFGSCLYCSDNTTVIIENTSFNNNTALRGGVIYCQNAESNIHARKMSLRLLPGVMLSKRFNDLENGVMDTSIILTSKLVINSCYIGPDGDLALNDGGTFYLQGSFIELYINRCNFSNAAMTEGGTIYAKGTSTLSIKIFIDECIFDGGGAPKGGHISIQQVVVTISNSTFLGTALFEGGAIKATKHSIVNLNSCYFTQSFPALGGSIYIEESVTLNIADSRFEPVLYIFGFSYISSVNNCSVIISRCHFTNDRIVPAYVVAFYIQNFGSLNVTDTLFETTLGINLIVLSATQNTTVYFTNCTFNKISGFRASYNTSVHIDNSRITNCINTLQTNGFMEISFQSELHITDSYINHNNVLESRTFIHVQFNSSLVLHDCNYHGNTMPSHLVASSDSYITIRDRHLINNTISDDSQSDLKGILALDSSAAMMYNSHIIKNTVNIRFGTMISVRNGEISVDGTVFHKNVHKVYSIFLLDSLYLLHVESTKNFSFTNSISENNNIDGFLKVDSGNSLANNFILIENCSFKDVDAYPIVTHNVGDIIIYNSYFYFPDAIALPYGILIQVGNSVRLLNSTFEGVSGTRQFSIVNDNVVSCVTKLFTLNSDFIKPGLTLKTRNANFMDKAESMGFIDIGFHVIIAHEETFYASSKFITLSF